MRSKLLVLFLWGSLVSAPLAAQSDVKISDFAFLAGYWIGDGFGGVSEEMWMPPMNDRMQGIYKHSLDGELVFSEFMDISRENGEFRLRLKHFNPDLTGWEEKNDFVTFRLVSVAPGKVIFRGLSYELLDPDHMKIELNLREDDGSTHTEVFNFTRQH